MLDYNCFSIFFECFTFKESNCFLRFILDLPLLFSYFTKSEWSKATTDNWILVLARLARHNNVVKMQGMLVPLRPITGKGGIRVDLNPTNYIQELDLGSSMIKSLSKPHETLLYICSLTF